MLLKRIPGQVWLLLFYHVQWNDPLRLGGQWHCDSHCDDPMKTELSFEVCHKNHWEHFLPPYEYVLVFLESLWGWVRNQYLGDKSLKSCYLLNLQFKVHKISKGVIWNKHKYTVSLLVLQLSSKQLPILTLVTEPFTQYSLYLHILSYRDIKYAQHNQLSFNNFLLSCGS